MTVMENVNHPITGSIMNAFRSVNPQNKAKGNTVETPVRVDTKSTLIIIDLPLIKLAVGESLCFSFSYSMYPAEER